MNEERLDLRDSARADAPAVRWRQPFAAELAAAMPGARYTARDRYCDFRRLFYETPEGMRVLAQILHEARVFYPSYVRGDTHETARNEGLRQLGLWIIEQVDHEPVDLPATQQVDPEEQI